MPALNPSTPRREGLRAGLVAALALLGGLAWSLAEAALPVTYSPLLVFWGTPQSVTAPRAWQLDPNGWRGLAAIQHALSEAGLLWLIGIRVLSALLIGAAALAVLHPAAFERPASYFLSPFRRAIAYLSALIIGFGAPVAFGKLGQAFTPAAMIGEPNAGAALRVALVFVLFCAPLWMIAGPGVLNVRAAVRFAHGAVVGLSTWAAFCLGVLLAGSVYDVVELMAIGQVFAAVDAASGTPGGTVGWIILATSLVSGLALALAGASAVAGAPQSVGAASRSGAAVAVGVTLVLLMLAGWFTAASGERRLAEAAPDVFQELSLEQDGQARPVVLLLGNDRAGIRVPRRQALLPQQLAADCAPAPENRDRRLPAASEANLAKLDAWMGAHGDEVSGRAARVHGCRVAILARLFRTEEARGQIFLDPHPSLIGFFGFRFAVQGVADYAADPAFSGLVEALQDTTRFTLTRSMSDSIAVRRERGVRTGSVGGRLVVAAPEAWRVALVSGAAAGVSPWLVSPRTDGLSLRYVVRTTSPSPDGSFSFDAAPEGAYFLALLAPGGTNPFRLSALSVFGDPGQFVVPAARRRDLGPIRLTF